jgi:hypothetical protein
MRGEAVALDSGNGLVHNPGKLTALIGVKDLIVIDTGAALLICRRDLDQLVLCPPYFAYLKPKENLELELLLALSFAKT